MTAQITEVLLMDGEQLAMAFCPPLPKEHPRILAADPDKNVTEQLRGLVRSTACWRGYVGTWSIEDDRLYLVKLEGRHHLDGAEPLLAEWFTGVLRVPRGAPLVYVHMGFGTVYESELHLKIEAGRVVAFRTVDNRGKTHDRHELTTRSLPGNENRFSGDDDF